MSEPMKVELSVDLVDLLEGNLGAIADALTDPAALHAAIGVGVERYLKDTVAADQVPKNHRTATKLGANPTGHLAKEYEGIELQTDAKAATLYVPASGRLRAAFGAYTVEPKSGRYLTIPANEDAYGRRAREFDDLFYTETGPSHQPVLARLLGFSAVTKKGMPGVAARLEIMFLLETSVDIPEDKDLIPWEKVEEKAVDSAGEHIDQRLEGRLA